MQLQISPTGNSGEIFLLLYPLILDSTVLIGNIRSHDDTLMTRALLAALQPVHEAKLARCAPESAQKESRVSEGFLTHLMHISPFLQL